MTSIWRLTNQRSEVVALACHTPTLNGVIQSANNINKVDIVSGEGTEVTPSHDDTNLIHFEDLNEGIITESSRVAMSSAGVYGEAKLGEWFKRPIVIRNYQWSEGKQLADSFDPFLLYFSRDVVKRKLNGYSRMRCDLKVKFVINATPFQYGMAYAAYKPLSYSKPFISPPSLQPSSEPEYDDFSGGIVGFSNIMELFIPYSTRNHIELLPQVNQGGELTIPFCYPGNWFPLVSGTFANPAASTGWGKIDLVSLIDLRSAAPDAGNDCNITVYAWCDSIELSGPANIEFQSGPLSSVMSGFSEILDNAGSTMRFIKPYTSVLSGVAGGVSSIAKLFGHTPNYTTRPAHRTTIVTNPGLAEGNDGCEVHNLQLTSANAIPMDPTDTGCPMVDELEMAYVLSKPVFVSYSNWTSENPPGYDLMRINVTPEIFTKIARTGVGGAIYFNVNQSMSSLLSSIHRYWRGPITYRVQVICSQYHRGRLRVVFDPAPGTTPGEGYQITKVMDLNETSVCEFEVPWFASTYWLECQHLAFDPLVNPSNVDSTLSNVPVPVGLAPFEPTQMLGRVYIEVLNELRSPNALADAAVVVYADTSKLEFAYPVGDVLGDEALLSNCMEPIDLQSGESNHYFGELNKSLRTLCQRSSDYMSYILNDPYEVWSTAVPRIPSGRGVVIASVPQAYDEPSYNGTFTNIATAHTKKGLINSLTFSSLIYPCYVGQRGSYVWRLHKGSEGGNVNDITATIYRWYKQLGTTTCSTGNVSFGFNTNSANGCTGYVKSSGTNEPYVASRVQMFLPFKFASCNPMASYNPKLVQAQDHVAFRLDKPFRGSPVANKHINNLVVAAGDDWTCFGFLNVPTMYVTRTIDGLVLANVTRT